MLEAPKESSIQITQIFLGSISIERAGSGGRIRITADNGRHFIGVFMLDATSTSDTWTAAAMQGVSNVVGDVLRVADGQ